MLLLDMGNFQRAEVEVSNFTAVNSFIFAARLVSSMFLVVRCCLHWQITTSIGVNLHHSALSSVKLALIALSLLLGSISDSI